MDSKKILMLLGGIALLVGAIFIVVKPSSPSTNAGSDVSVVNQPFLVTSEDHVKGEATASATIIEYADYQCPGCAQAYGVMEMVAQQLGSRVKIVYRHFPLIEIHNNAIPAARAAEAAGRQNKFWEMSKLLYERQQEWENERNAVPKYQAYAQELGLNADQFMQDFNNPVLLQKITNERKSAEKLQLTGTPSFFLNGEKMRPPRSAEDVKALLDEKGL